MKKLLLASLLILSSPIYAHEFNFTYTVDQFEDCYDKFDIEKAQDEVNKFAKSLISKRLRRKNLTLLKPIEKDIFKLRIYNSDKGSPIVDLSRFDGTRDYFGYDEYVVLSESVIRTDNENVQLDINIQGQEWGYDRRNFLSFEKTSNNKYDENGRIIGNETSDMTCSAKFKTAIKINNIKNSETGIELE